MDDTFKLSTNHLDVCKKCRERLYIVTEQSSDPNFGIRKDRYCAKCDIYYGCRAYGLTTPWRICEIHGENYSENGKCHWCYVEELKNENTRLKEDLEKERVKNKNEQTSKTRRSNTRTSKER